MELCVEELWIAAWFILKQQLLCELKKMFSERLGNITQFRN